MDVSSSYASDSMNILFVVCKLVTGGVWDTVSVWNACLLDPGITMNFT